MTADRDHLDDLISKRSLTFLEERERRLRRSYLRIEKALNAAYEKFNNPNPTVGQFFRNTLIQTRIFQYEIEVELSSIIRNEPKGFAKAIAFKGLIHKIVEYNKHLDNHLIPEMLELAMLRGIPFGPSERSQIKKKWRKTFNTITSWKNLRNKATGHYDSNIEMAIELLESMDVEEVRRVVDEFVAFCKELMDQFRLAGSADSKGANDRTAPVISNSEILKPAIDTER